MDTLSLFTLAFGLGLLHALDADHIAAVSAMAGHKAGLKSGVRYCLRWSLGHGLVLLLVGAAVLLLGMSIPERLSAIAEYLVGFVLIGVGAMIFVDLYRRKAHIHFHTHDDLPPHAHWHTHQAHKEHDAAAHKHNHKATMVGAIHGMAGSSPLLLLLPLGQMASPWVGVFYLLMFSLGVVAAMLLFGGILGVIFSRFARIGERVLNVFRGAIGGGAVLFGGYLLIA